jgi:hypothetical protein
LSQGQRLGLLKFSKGRASVWAVSGGLALSFLAGFALGGADYFIGFSLLCLGPGLTAFIRRILADGKVLKSLALAAIPWLTAIPFLSLSLSHRGPDYGPAATAIIATISFVWLSAFSALLGHVIGIELHTSILRRWPRLLVLMPIPAPRPGKLPVPLPSKAERRILK